MATTATPQTDLSQVFELSRLDVAEHTGATPESRVQAGILITMYNDNSAELHPFIHFEPGCYIDAQNKLKGALTPYSVLVEDSLQSTSERAFPGTEFQPPLLHVPFPLGARSLSWSRETPSGRIAQSLWSDMNMLDSKTSEFGWNPKSGIDEGDQVARQALHTLVESFDTAKEQLVTAISSAEERDRSRIRALLPIPNRSIQMRDLVLEYLDGLTAWREVERKTVESAGSGPALAAESWSALKGMTKKLDETLRSMGLERMTVAAFEAYVKGQSN